MPIKYVGRTHDFYGKSMWEILGNLKGFGVGRLVKRYTFDRYPEPSYNRIIKVETPKNDEGGDKKVRVWIEKVFRGKKYPQLVELYRTSYKTDYRLIPKDEEEDILARVEAIPRRETIVANYTSFPPLLKEFIIEEMKEKGETINEEPKLKLVIRNGRDNVARLAKEGEIPNVLCESGLGKPASPELYKI
uniref:Uncharacterized protein n=1 Tax=Clastoptera arizonana TaxID=38151 RepID=A0A1B6D1J7_9HEMI